MSSQHCKVLLKQANLLNYQDKFISYGADDAKQIALCSSTEFSKLLDYTGMSSKPLHVTRLLDTLNELYGIAPRYNPPPVPSKGELIYQGQPDYTSTPSSELFLNLPKKRKVNPYYGEVQLPSDDVFDSLTEQRTEEETRNLIMSLSAIYKSEPLTRYQQYINACAAELAMRDPTLLARRADLTVKAREANIKGGHFKFHRGYSSAKTAPKDPSTNSGINFTTASRHRQARLTEIQKLEKLVNTYMFEKDGLVGRLSHETGRNNKVSIGVVRSRLDHLEEQIYVAKKRLKKLRHAQKRSENYFIAKLNKADQLKDNIQEDISKRAQIAETALAESSFVEVESNAAHVEVGAPIKITNNKLNKNAKNAPRNLVPFPDMAEESLSSNYQCDETIGSDIDDKPDILTDVFTAAIADNSLDAFHMAQ